MATTNAQIILMEQLKLVDAGILKYTGNIIEAVNPMTGEVEEFPEIQPIHTYARWRELGYQVKKGEKAVASFPIWKYSKRKPKNMDEEEAQAKGFCFMKLSYWFTEEQVMPIKNKE